MYATRSGPLADPTLPTCVARNLNLLDRNESLLRAGSLSP